MTITAKFPGVCLTCGGKIRKGDQIEWKKDAGSKHAACASGQPAPTPAPRPRKPSAPRTRREPPPDGPMLRNDRAPYTRGDVLVSQLTAGEVVECEARQSIAATEIPGEPCKGDRRRVAVVVIHTDRMSPSDADDNGHCGQYGAIVRLATAEEAAPILAERAAKAQADAAELEWDAQRAELTAGRIFVDGGKIERSGAEVLHEERKRLHGTVSERWSRLADGSVLTERYSYDDDRWGRWVTTEQLLAEARAADRSLEDAIRGQRYSAVDRAIVWLAAKAGKTPRPPVTVTLHGMEQPVTLTVRPGVQIGGQERIVAEPLDGGSVRAPDGQRYYEWTWSLSGLRQQLGAAAPAEAFADIEFAPGAEIGGGDRLTLSGGLWIEGMRAALAELEARS